jgi:AbrB family looped-hinge helix DNA binding protein
MEFKETIVDRFGRIVIPKKIREDFNLEAGTQVRFEKSEQDIVLSLYVKNPIFIGKMACWYFMVQLWGI